MERIFEAYKNWDERELGRLYGYPETAIEAYMPEKEFDSEKVVKYDNTPVRKFTGFVFSKDNYNEELKVSIKWHDAIKNNVPGIYREICEKVNKVSLIKGKPPNMKS